ncbi:ribonuclease T1 [Herbihabitans rhizosphaerae]|uniref:Ribonuclease T1 n=1 Tax=Herbihabitans rhizosphaerae TaxID=1872711 RepID=A0A4Q7KUW4_9PSEU|nr:ribonuclease domain-containing protein [Herbihabitans rhizosphaerae]RZS39302.1 ribonuclease T1 [Herbihabitans rhizosphaerae]
MTNITSRAARSALAVLVAVLTALGLGTAAYADTTVPAAPAAECGDTSGFTVVPLSQLPPEATDTEKLIETDGPFPYPQDGTVFQNREGLLPQCPSEYYHEYTVKTPGSDDRGARRIVTGEGGEHFYTKDHYETFVLIDRER